jgi:hypothetical protein
LIGRGHTWRGRMNRTIHVPAGIFDSRSYGFAPVAIMPTPFGNTVHVSGQVARDAEQRIVGAGDIGRQLDKIRDVMAQAIAPKKGRSASEHGSSWLDEDGVAWPHRS